MSFENTSNLTPTELSVVAIAILQRKSYALTNICIDEESKDSIGRTYYNQKEDKRYTYFYPIQINLAQENDNLFTEINNYRSKNVTGNILIPIIVAPNDYALIELTNSNDDKNNIKATVFSYSNSGVNKDLTKYIQQKLRIPNADQIEVLNPHNVDAIITNEIDSHDTSIIVCEQLESIINNDEKFVRSDLLSARKKYQAYFKEEAKPDNSPWYMSAGNIGLQTAPIGAAIGFLIGNVPGAVIGAALGTLVGFGAGILASAIQVLYELRSKPEFPLEQLDETENERLTNQMNEKVWYKLSNTQAFNFDVRFFMGAAAGTAIGGAIGTLILPGIGTVIGAGIGTLISGTAALVHPLIASKTASEKKLVDITRKWNQESTYDVPWFTRAFIGATTGATLGAMIGSFVPVIGTIIGGAAGTLIGAALTLASPTVFAMTRSSKKSKEANAGQQIPADQPNDADIEERHWYTQSMFDMSWYVRFLTAGLGGATLGAAIGTAIFPGIGTLVGGLIGFGAAGLTAIASPFIFNLTNKFIKNIFKNDTAPINDKNSLDIPWYIRLFAGATAGAGIGTAIGTIVPVIGNIIGAAVGASLGTIFALASPAIKELLLSPSNPAYQAKSDTMQSIPWYLRAAVGTMMGATLGGTIGTFIPIPGLGTALGITIGTLVGVSIVLIAPLLARASKTTSTLEKIENAQVKHPIVFEDNKNEHAPQNDLNEQAAMYKHVFHMKKVAPEIEPTHPSEQPPAGPRPSA